jgi:hypothetical protein
MSDEKTSQMNINIGKRVRNYVLFFVVLILFLIWGNDIASLLAISLSTDKDKSEAAQKIIASIITAIGGVAVLLLNLGRDIDLHNLIDKTIFRVRHKTGDIIHNKMIEAAQRVGATSWRNMQDKRREVSYLFYHFVNNQVVLRDLAFTYWEQYFVNIYVICFAFLGFIISSTFVLLRWRLDLALVAPIAFLLILLAVGITTWKSLVRKICDLPIQQIEEIRTGHADELRDEVEKRFADVLKP